MRKEIFAVVLMLLIVLTGCGAGNETLPPTVEPEPTPTLTATAQARQTAAQGTASPEELGYQVPEFSAAYYFGDPDLDFFGVSMLVTTSREIFESYGAPESVAYDYLPATGGAMLYWRYEGLAFTLAVSGISSADEMAEIAAADPESYSYPVEGVEVMRGDFIGPRGLRVGMKDIEALLRFPDDGLQPYQTEQTEERLLYYRSEGIEGFPPMPPYGLILHSLSDEAGDYLIEYCYPQHYETDPPPEGSEEYIYSVCAYLQIQIRDGVIQSFSVFFAAMAE